MSVLVGMEQRDPIRTVVVPSFGDAFSAWFGDGAWLTGNPKTCADLTRVRHFWIGNSVACACGAMEWRPGEAEPRDVVARKVSR